MKCSNCKTKLYGDQCYIPNCCPTKVLCPICFVKKQDKRWCKSEKKVAIECMFCKDALLVDEDKYREILFNSLTVEEKVRIFLT